MCAVLIQSRVRMASARFRPLKEEDAQEFYAEAAEAEVVARENAAARFRGSPWSQDDEFHNKEATFVRDYSKKHRIPVASLLEVLDRGMHEKWSTVGASPDPRVIPCRPRLTY